MKINLKRISASEHVGMYIILIFFRYVLSLNNTRNPSSTSTQDVRVRGVGQGLQAKVLMLPPQAMWAGMNE